MARRKKRKRLNLLPLFVAAIGAALFVSYILLVAQFNREGEAIPTASPTPSASASAIPTRLPNSSTTPLPSTALLTVPFISQAPQEIWDPLHEDACEEASALTAYYFLRGKQIASLGAVDEELTALVRKGEALGQAPSITLSQLSDLVREQYDFTPTVRNLRSIEDLKRELAEGRPVIIPAAGKLLGNPHFRNGGPEYHMLVLVGYDEQGFISNDPGTRHGEGYRYGFDTIFQATHDYDASDILRGAKRYMVFES